MLKKLFNIITQSDLDNAVKAYDESVTKISKDYNRSLEQATKEYNAKLAVLKTTVKVMNKEIDSLHEDIAMALCNENLPKRGIVIVTSPELIESKKLETEVSIGGQLVEIAIKNLKAEEMIKRLEDTIKTLPANQAGRGGIEVLENGEYRELGFSSTSELKEILKRAKRGEITIVEQDGL